MKEELTKISVICNKKIALELMNHLNDWEDSKVYLHWYEDNPSEEDLEMHEELKGSVRIKI